MAKNSSFVRVLGKVERKARQLQGQIQVVQCCVRSNKMQIAYEQALRLEELSERLTLLTRALPAYTGVPTALLDVEQVLERTIPVEIGFTKEEWFILRMPLLLPKKEKGSADYIRSFLYPAMRDFFQGKEPVRYEDCVLIYRYVYSRDRPERQMRDHDNIETNMVTDTVAMYVLPDDAPKYCSHYSCSAVGKTERTEVYVIPKEDFGRWLEQEKNMPDEGVIVYENRSENAKKDM